MNRRVNFGEVIMIICQRGVNISQIKFVFCGNLIGTFPQPFMPDYDILNSNPMPCDTRFPARNAGRNLNVPIQCKCRHSSLLAD